MKESKGAFDFWGSGAPDVENLSLKAGPLEPRIPETLIRVYIYIYVHIYILVLYIIYDIYIYIYDIIHIHI